MSFWQTITKTLNGGNDAANNGGETVLVESARRGDARAFDALVGSYQAQLKGFIARRVNAVSEDDPEIMIRWKFLLDYLGSFHSGGRPPGSGSGGGAGGTGEGGEGEG